MMKKRKRRTAGDFEIRHTDKAMKDLDEVVVFKPDHVHLEYMGKCAVLILVDLPKGRLLRVALWSRGKINGLTEVE